MTDDMKAPERIFLADPNNATEYGRKLTDIRADDPHNLISSEVKSRPLTTYVREDLYATKFVDLA